MDGRNNKSCLFCDSMMAVNIEAAYIVKILNLFQVSSEQRLANERICMRCVLNIDSIDGANKMRDLMMSSLKIKLNGQETNQHSANPIDDGLDLPSQNIPNIKPEPARSQRRPMLLSSENGQGWYTGTGSRVHRCHKCNINLKTRPLKDAMKHVSRCTGSGLRRGRPSTPRQSELFPCSVCGRNFASKDVLVEHSSKCNGAPRTYSRGRKPADNTCMVCGEDMVYRHILKKHLKIKHDINAQRLDDSVLTALKTGTNTGHHIKEHILAQIQHKIREEANNENKNGNVGVVKNEPNDQDNEDEGYKESETVLPTAEKPEETRKEKTRYIRSRKMVRPSKYIAESYSCNICNKCFDDKEQYDTHCCFPMQDNVSGSNEEMMGEILSEEVVESADNSHELVV